MAPRIDYASAAPDTLRAVVELDQFVVNRSGLDPRLLSLIKLRASQLNGCAYCVDMHTKEARRDGLNEQAIALTCVWHESPLFDSRERAVLSWTDALTRLGATGVPDEAFEPLRQYFTDAEIAHISVTIGIINMWNRIAVGFQAQHSIDVRRPDVTE